jgi:hypothetical protein
VNAISDAAPSLMKPIALSKSLVIAVGRIRSSVSSATANWSGLSSTAKHEGRPAEKIDLTDQARSYWRVVAPQAKSPSERWPLPGRNARWPNWLRDSISAGVVPPFIFDSHHLQFPGNIGSFEAINSATARIDEAFFGYRMNASFEDVETQRGCGTRVLQRPDGAADRQYVTRQLLPPAAAA